MSGPLRSMKRQITTRPKAHKAWRELYLGIHRRISEKQGPEGEIKDEDVPAVEELLEIKEFMDTLATRHSLI